MVDVLLKITVLKLKKRSNRKPQWVGGGTVLPRDVRNSKYAPPPPRLIHITDIPTVSISHDNPRVLMS